MVAYEKGRQEAQTMKIPKRKPKPAFRNVLTGEPKQWKIHKRLVTKVVAVAYESGRLRESQFIAEFVWETKREIQNVVAYGRWSPTRVVVQRELTVNEHLFCYDPAIDETTKQ